MTFTDQSRYEVRFEWGLRGLESLSGCFLFVVVDVLSFTTCVSIALERGAVIFPFSMEHESADAFAQEKNARLAGRRGDPESFNLSPRSLLSLTPGERLVLPSLNGATLSLAAGRIGRVLSGSLVNRSAVARLAASSTEGAIAVIAAGERWPKDDGLRPCLEDLVGAGSIIERIPGRRSPEAEAAVAAFRSVADSLPATLAACSSGRELAERGFGGDVELAAQLDTVEVAPELVKGAFAPSGDLH